jgi:hypothetical protein
MHADAPRQLGNESPRHLSIDSRAPAARDKPLEIPYGLAGCLAASAVILAHLRASAFRFLSVR